jgi:DNA-binding transcriptional LysR family regulator
LARTDRFVQYIVIKKLVEVGLGISILPLVAVAAELRLGRLGAARLRGIDLSREMGLVHRKGKYLSRALEAMIAALERDLRRGPAAVLGRRGSAPRRRTVSRRVRWSRSRRSPR